METTMIGREKEKQYLEDYLDSGKSAIAVGTPGV